MLANQNKKVLIITLVIVAIVSIASPFVATFVGRRLAELGF